MLGQKEKLQVEVKSYACFLVSKIVFSICVVVCHTGERYLLVLSAMALYLLGVLEI